MTDSFYPLDTGIPLILASGSPRRKQLLEELGLTFRVIVREVEEVIAPGLSPAEVAIAISEAKAEAYQDLSENSLVITADTIVVFGEKILGKPADSAEAIEMIGMLSGKVHSVISGVTLTFRDESVSFYEETRVQFRKLEAEEIRYYVEKFRPMDKAGAYGIQEWIGMVGVESIEGDFYNVMGLPVGKLFQALKAFNPIKTE